MKKFPALSLLIVFIILIFPYISYNLGNYHIVHIATLLEIYIILALGLNIIIGYAGMLNLGFAAFYAIGAYFSAIASIKLGLSMFILIPLSGIFVCIFSLILSLPTIKLRGDYFAIVTLGFGEITRIVINNWDYLTNGPKGLPRVGESIKTTTIFNFKFDSDLSFFYIVFLIVTFAIFISKRLENSQLGRALHSIRSDEIAAQTVGINSAHLKLLAIATGTFLAGVSGCLYTHWIGFITPEVFTFMESVLLVCMIVLGGMGNIYGVILGTILIVGIPEILRDLLGSQFALYRMVVFGLALIFMIIFRPQGIIPAKRGKILTEIN